MKKKLVKTISKKVPTNGFRVNVLSRHPSHKVLRQMLKRQPVRVAFRLGSVTETPNTTVEINSVQSIKNSMNKRLMKECFDRAGVPTPKWTSVASTTELMEKINSGEFQFPIIAKSLFGSRGVGNTYIDSENNLINWAAGRNFKNYIFEQFANYGLEYRLHITRNGCFYTCRKALKSDTPENQRWFRNSSNSVWFLEENPAFRKPNSWNDIVSQCQLALAEIGADVLSFDVRVQSEMKSDGSRRKYQSFALIECNSASSMHSETTEMSVCATKYLEVIPELIKEKLQ